MNEIINSSDIESMNIHDMLRIVYPNSLEVDESPTDEAKKIQEAMGLPPEFIIASATLKREPVNPYNSYGTKQEPIASYGKKVYAIQSADPTSKKPISHLCSINVESIDIRQARIAATSKKDNSKRFPFDSGHSYYSTSGDTATRAFVNILFNGKTIPILCMFYDVENLFDIKISKDLNIIFNGKKVGIFDVNQYLNRVSYYTTGYRSQVFDMTLFSINSLQHLMDVKNEENLANVVRYLSLINQYVTLANQIPTKNGISKCYNRVEPFAKDAWQDHPFGVSAFYSIARMSNKTQDSVKMSVLFNSFYDEVSDKESFIKKCEEIWSFAKLKKSIPNSLSFQGCPFRIFEEHDLYKAQRKKALASNGNRAFNKLMQEFDSLKIDEKSFPRTTKLIKSGSIPLTTFFRKSEQYFLLNDNWILWEEMLKRGHEEILVELAGAVSGRTTYEKDLMSYFYFVLYGLPEYLKKHTGLKWTCTPRLVSSASELEPPADDGTGTRRERSALTPIVDNENHTVVVPYASLAIGGGFGTTYCYGLNYSVLNKGFSYNGNACAVDIEEKLNDRDDYGLMFYTLTGSAQGRGYPSFLIIFERRSTGTHVHFHRVHPSRSKDGDYNPVHNWIRVCYNWMVGNIHKSLIKYQQGDLVFISVDPEQEKGLVFSEYVEKYDNHNFKTPVGFAKYEKKEKSNILGYVRLIEDNVLQHNEHEHVPMKEGTYEIRQCRSWEANPKGVWSLRID